MALIRVMYKKKNYRLSAFCELMGVSYRRGLYVYNLKGRPYKVDKQFVDMLLGNAKCYMVKEDPEWEGIPRRRCQVTIDGVLFKSYTDAAKEYKVPIVRIRRRVEKYGSVLTKAQVMENGNPRKASHVMSEWDRLSSKTNTGVARL